MYLDFQVKIPTESAGITRKKLRKLLTFTMHMNIITIQKKDILSLRTRRLESVQMMIRS